MASHTDRLLAANAESDGHRAHLIRLAAKENPNTSEVELWAEILAAKTGRTFHFAPDEPVDSPHKDGINCEHCLDGGPLRHMCSLCSRDAVVIQGSHFGALVCDRHSRWLGDDEAGRSSQHPVGAAQVKAAHRFGKLQRQGRLTPLLYATIRDAALTPTNTDGELLPLPVQHSTAYPAVVKVAAAVTTGGFARSLFNPALTYAQAFDILERTVQDATDTRPTEIALALWRYVRPTFWALRNAVLTDTPYEPAWAHDYVVPATIADDYTANLGAPETFTNYASAIPGVHLRFEEHLNGVRTVQRTRGSNNGPRRALLVICPEGHQFETLRKSAHLGRKAPPCPVCTHKVVVHGYNDLATVNPKIGGELDPALNGGITARDIAAASHKELAWRCPRAGHVYWATASNRTQAGMNCGICANRTVVAGINDIATTYPHIAAEMEPESALINPPTTLAAGSGVKPRWVCPNCDHIYEMTVHNRTHGGGCEPCRKANALASRQNITVTHPDIAAEWHPTRNGDKLPEHYSHGSKEEVYWQCPSSAKHWYKTRIERRTAAGYNCSVCSRRTLVFRVNDLATTDPVLVTEFHTYRNGLKTPDRIVAGTELYWWKCAAAGHVTRQTVPHRRKSKGCTECPPDHRVLAGAV
jgi:hypothetical protein